MQKLSIFTDGGARGNPGPAAVGVVIKNEKGEIIHQFGKTIGETTNNVAEYTAVVEGLKWVKGWVMGCVSSCEDKGEDVDPTHTTHPRPITHNSSPPQIYFYLDSSLVVNQLNGVFKIKDNRLQELALKVHQLETEINIFPTYNHIPREKNWQADKLVNEALDSHVPSADIKAQKE